MANTANNIKDVGSVIAKLAAGFLKDHGQFIKSIDKADPSDFNGKNGYSAGDTINVSIPSQFTAGSGAAITAEDVLESSVALAVNNQTHVAIEFTSAEIATDIALKAWAKRILEPAMITIANEIESQCLQLAADATANSVGTAGTLDAGTNIILSAGEQLDISGCSDYSNRFVLLNPSANRDAVVDRKGLFQSSESISHQYKKGYMGQADGFDFLRNNMLPTHTMGNDVTGVAVDDASTATGASTLHCDGFTANTGTVKKGSVFTIADVYDVHPVTKDALSSLKQFVVTADGTADANGDITLAISPTIYSGTSRQNVDALAADDAALVFVGAADSAHVQNLAYHKSAFRFVSLPLQMPDGVDMKGQETLDGITVRVLRDYAIGSDKMIMRLDVLWGMANVRPEWACRITN